MQPEADHAPALTAADACERAAARLDHVVELIGRSGRRAHLTWVGPAADDFHRRLLQFEAHAAARSSSLRRYAAALRDAAARAPVTLAPAPVRP